MELCHLNVFFSPFISFFSALVKEEGSSGIIIKADIKLQLFFLPQDGNNFM